jgi:5-methylcytosine-specific restriction endonuclease McrA
MRLYKYTVEGLREAIRTSHSYRQVLQKLGVVPAGGNYTTLKKAIKFFDVDISHFKKQGWNRGVRFGPKRPLSDYLSNKHSITSDSLRKRLISEGIFEATCSVCQLTMWCDQPIPLELDHVNGKHEDNSLDNLRLLCPNCHAQTPNYRGRKKRVDCQKQGGHLRSQKYCQCGTIICRAATYCKSCVPRQTKIDWPLIPELKARLAQSNYSKLARELGVSDNAVRKRLQRYS